MNGRVVGLPSPVGEAGVGGNTAENDNSSVADPLIPEQPANNVEQPNAVTPDLAEESQPISTPQSADSGVSTPFPQRFLSETGIPDGTSVTIMVDKGTIHVLTSGPACVLNECLTGEEDQGSVIILLPRSEAYSVTGLVPTQNWHGAYFGEP